MLMTCLIYQKARQQEFHSHRTLTLIQITELKMLDSIPALIVKKNTKVNIKDYNTSIKGNGQITYLKPKFEDYYRVPFQQYPMTPYTRNLTVEHEEIRR
jgi:hypothetical protein